MIFFFAKMAEGCQQSGQQKEVIDQESFRQDTFLFVHFGNILKEKSKKSANNIQILITPHANLSSYQHEYNNAVADIKELLALPEKAEFKAPYYTFLFQQKAVQAAYYLSHLLYKIHAHTIGRNAAAEDIVRETNNFFNNLCKIQESGLLEKAQEFFLAQQKGVCMNVHALHSALSQEGTHTEQQNQASLLCFLDHNKKYFMHVYCRLMFPDTCSQMIYIAAQSYKNMFCWMAPFLSQSNFNTAYEAMDFEKYEQNPLRHDVYISWKTSFRQYGDKVFSQSTT